MGFENGHLARASLVASDGINEVVNTLHYDLVGNALDDAPSLQNLADRLAAVLMGPWAALFHSEWTISPVTVMDEQDPQNLTAPRSGAISGTPTTGTGGLVSTDNTAPLEECVVATLHTALIGRRHRGRIFLPPIFDENATSAGLLASGKRSQYVTFLDAIPHEPDIITGASTATAKWCVYSKTQRAANLDPYASAIVSYTLHDRLRWLRSRGR